LFDASKCVAAVAAGYWIPMAQNLQLTDDQKAALKMCWSRVKANKAALTEQHSRLSERLAELQLRQQQRQQEFEVQAVQLPVQQAVQQRRYSASRPPPSPPPPPQQQQQELHQPQTLLQLPASSQQFLQADLKGDLEMQQLEAELQEVERMLFLDLGFKSSELSVSSSSVPAWSEGWSSCSDFLQDEQQRRLFYQDQEQDQELQECLGPDLLQDHQRQQQQQQAKATQQQLVGALHPLLPAQWAGQACKPDHLERCTDGNAMFTSNQSQQFVTAVAAPAAVVDGAAAAGTVAIKTEQVGMLAGSSGGAPEHNSKLSQDDSRARQQTPSCSSTLGHCEELLLSVRCCCLFNTITPLACCSLQGRTLHACNHLVAADQSDAAARAFWFVAGYP
jgi:hypothetical protein